MNKFKKSDELNNGYLSHGILARIYRVVDFIGYKLFAPKPFQINSDVANPEQCISLLFINLGRIGDLILFRYVIEDFIKQNYTITILIQDKYKFLFETLSNNPQIDIITVSNYADKKIVRGFFQIYKAIKQTHKKYSASLHFRGYLGTGILATYLSRVSQNLIGYGTSGFGFLLNRKVTWQENAHETIHILQILQVIEPNYSSINLQVFNSYLLYCDTILNKYKLVDGQYIVIHATSQDAKKNIPQDTLATIVKHILTNSTLSIVFVGLTNEVLYIKESLKLNNASQQIVNTEQYSNRIIITNGTYKFFEIYALLSKAKLFIGVDSSIAHLSSGLTIPKIIMWHSQNILGQWKPLGDNVYTLPYSNHMFVAKLLAYTSRRRRLSSPCDSNLFE